jgi:DNA-binding response OmpR family regulator
MPGADLRCLLLVEDDHDDVIFMEQAFRDAGLDCPYRVLSDGVDVIEYLEGRADYADRKQFPLPSHLLLDLKLPRKSGIEILDWVRRHPDFKNLAVIVLSSSKEANDIARARELGIDDYLVKPVSYAHLLGMVKGVVEIWKLGPAPG